jgi:hypothetical protein
MPETRIVRRPPPMPISKVLLLIAVILFIFVALGEHPRLLEDFELVPAGLAFGFGSFLVEK